MILLMGMTLYCILLYRFVVRLIMMGPPPVGPKYNFSVLFNCINKATSLLRPIFFSEVALLMGFHFIKKLNYVVFFNR